MYTVQKSNRVHYVHTVDNEAGRKRKCKLGPNTIHGARVAVTYVATNYDTMNKYT